MERRSLHFIAHLSGGRLIGQLEMKKASQKTAALRYRKTVLTAWSEVDNALTAYEAEQKRNLSLKAQVAADQRSWQLAQDQYRHGLQSFLQVLDAERRLLSSQTQLADSTAVISDNLVRLYNALGAGGRQPTPTPASLRRRRHSTAKDQFIEGQGRTGQNPRHQRCRGFVLVWWEIGAEISVCLKRSERKSGLSPPISHSASWQRPYQKRFPAGHREIRQEAEMTNPLKTGGNPGFLSG